MCALDDWNVARSTNMRFMFHGATKFNQCIATWADETTTKYYVYCIFQDSGCPDQNSALNVAPWCQGKDEKFFARQAPGTSSLTNLLTLSLGAPTTDPITKQKKTTKKNNKN